MESRKHTEKGTRLNPSSDLPLDYTRMVKGVYDNNFNEGLEALNKLTGKKSEFQIAGTIFSDEIIFVASLVTEKQLSATTFYCSSDYDPKASSPTAQDILATCVDAAGGFFETYLDPKNTEKLEQLVGDSLSSLEDVPFEWTKVEFEKRQLWVKVDKANLSLDQLTDDWLAQNDPEAKIADQELEEESKDLFVTGKNPKKTSGSGSSNIH